MVSLYILFPESIPSFPWMSNNEALLDEDRIVVFVKELEEKIKVINLESYNGNYDSDNIRNFLENFLTLEEYFPSPEHRRIQLLLKNWDNWKDEIQQKAENEYFLFHQKIENHTFCECAQILIDSSDKKVVIVNHYGNDIQGNITITLETTEISVPNLETNQKLITWFANNRIPTRNFHIIPKHGENRQEVIRWRNNEDASPLRCSKEEAQELLKTAIGKSLKELFNYDGEYHQFLVFKHENNTPQNLYHGYHIPLDSTEIPENIKTQLLKNVE